MRKGLYFFASLMGVLVSLFVFLKSATPVYAGVAGNCCGKFNCTSKWCDFPACPKPGWKTTCTCSQGCGTGGGSCNPGTYSCIDKNGGHNCCAIGNQPCFPAGTKISIPGNQSKNIEDIKIGDKVISQDTNGVQSISTVQQTQQPISDNLCKIKYTNGDSLSVTKGHPLFTQNGWKAIDVEEAAKEDPGVPVTTLGVGDFMQKVDGSWPQIASISCEVKTIQTYNFTVDANHDYFAGGFLAHNKGGCFPAGTKVQMGDGTQKNIEDVKVGDTVISENSSGTKSVGTVQALERPLTDNLCTIKYTNNESLEVTNSHPLFTPTGWKAINPEAALSENPGVQVTRLLPGDFMKKLNGEWSQISSVTCRPENNLQVYNFTVDGNHDYFAGGYLAHNKGTCGGCHNFGADPGQNPVTSFTVTQTSLTSALIQWAGAAGFCTKRGQVDIFIGRNKGAVQANCGYNAGDGVGSANSPDIDTITPQGGNDGGGNGGDAFGNNPQNGTAGTGGGGGGGGQSDVGASGGRGVVIVRFPQGSITVTPTGGVCVPVGTDTVCKFAANGNLAVASGSTNAQVLVVGGGGAGGQRGGGGGGGGAVHFVPSFALNSPKNYTVIVGAGGVFGPPHGHCDPNSRKCGWIWVDGGGGHPGGTSVFGTIGATGGGGGGSAGTGCDPNNGNKCLNYDVNGGNGGSGGGGAIPDGYFKSAGGAGIAGQGNNGGNVPVSSGLGGAGGGGGVQAGKNGQTQSTGGPGGNGNCFDISGSMVCYGGGGGGGSVWQALPPGCTWARSVANDVTSLNTATSGISLAANTVYYVKVTAHYVDPSGGGSFCGAVPAQGYCSTTLSPSTANVNVGDTIPFKTILNDIHPYATNVVYTGSPTYFSFNPATSSVNPFNTLAKALAKTPVAGAKVTTSVYLQPGDPSPACTDSSIVTINPAANANPWWQVKDSDVASAANTDINSSVPGSLLFDLDGGGKYPGVVAYGGATNLTSTDVSSQKWLAASALANPKAYGYDFFANQIPSSITMNTVRPGDDLAADLGNPAAVADPNGYHWFKYSSTTTDLTLANPFVVGAKKIILFVDAPNFNINSTINGVTKGSGFFLVIVKGNINVSTSVGGVAPQVNPNLEGIYVADGKFTDGTKTPANDTQLFLRGSIAIYGGVSLQRDLGGAPNASDPAELFLYGADQVMLFPKALSTRKINWKEVAP